MNGVNWVTKMVSRLQTPARGETSVRTHQEADITTNEHKVSFGSIVLKKSSVARGEVH
jgi:hypothetical protein